MMSMPLNFRSGNYDVDPRFVCQMSVNKITTKGEEELTQLKLRYDVDAVKQNHISGLLSSKYKGEGNIDAVKESYEPYYDGVSLSQTIHIEGLPTWKWATATPYTGTHAQTMLLREAYRNLMDALSDPNRKKSAERSIKLPQRSWVGSMDSPQKSSMTLLILKGIYLVAIKWLNRIGADLKWNPNLVGDCSVMKINLEIRQ